MGLDIGGPVDTPIYAFADGQILHYGYNSAPGDYGNVIVTKH
jgi:murein DD-endopeptidase MepM/ murein hydrolase activator NlpD